MDRKLPDLAKLLLEFTEPLTFKRIDDDLKLKVTERMREWMRETSYAQEHIPIPVRDAETGELIGYATYKGVKMDELTPEQLANGEISATFVYDYQDVPE